MIRITPFLAHCRVHRSGGVVGGGVAPVPLLDQSFERAIDGSGPGVQHQDERGHAAYRLDLRPPYALRGASGGIIAFLERIRERETSHMLAFHGKADEFSTVYARDYSRYYQVRVCSETMLSASGRRAGLQHVGVLRGGLRSDHSSLCFLTNPPGQYPPGLAVMPMQEGRREWQ